MAAGFSVLAAIGFLVGSARGAGSLAEAARDWVMAVGFYIAAGIVGGALFGLLRPIRGRYWGRLLTAYLILLLVYGGATVAFWPVFTREDGGSDVPLSFFLIGWAVICIVLAPVYVWQFSANEPNDVSDG